MKKKENRMKTEKEKGIMLTSQWEIDQTNRHHYLLNNTHKKSNKNMAQGNNVR